MKLTYSSPVTVMMVTLVIVCQVSTSSISNFDCFLLLS